MSVALLRFSGRRSGRGIRRRIVGVLGYAVLPCRWPHLLCGGQKLSSVRMVAGLVVSCDGRPGPPEQTIGTRPPRGGRTDRSTLSRSHVPPCRDLRPLHALACVVRDIRKPTGMVSVYCGPVDHGNRIAVEVRDDQRPDSLTFPFQAHPVPCPKRVTPGGKPYAQLDSGSLTGLSSSRRLGAWCFDAAEASPLRQPR